MSLKFILILAICIIYVNATSNIFYSLKLILGLGREMDRIIKTAIKNKDNKRSIIDDIMTSAIDKLSGHHRHCEKIDNALMDISSQLNYLVMHMHHKIGVIESEIQESSMPLEIDLVGREILGHITNIRRHYMMTARYSNEMEFYNRDELKSVFKTLTDQTSGKDIRSSLIALCDKIVGPGIGYSTSSFLKLYEEYVKMRNEELCGTGISPNNYLFNLYTIIVSVEMMGLISLSFHYELQHELYKNSTIDKVLEAAQEDREVRLEKYFMNFERAIETLPLVYRSCDPSERIRGETFFEMEDLYQTIVTHEYGKNKPGSCEGGCETIDIKDFQENGTICGRMWQCSAIEYPTICKLTGQLRKYQWIKYAGHTYGVESECSEVNGYESTFIQRKWCDICRCLCEGNSLKLAERDPNSTHVISLFPVSSDISNNMMITGVRLKVKDGIVHIQIKEGQLQAMGQVTSSCAWKNVPDMKTGVNLVRNNKSTIYQEGRDFVVIDQNHNAINLDDVMAPPGYLISGIKWGLAQKDEKDPGWRLEIQIRYTPFNFTSGALGNSFESQWMSSSTIHNQLLELGGDDSPEKSMALNIPTEAPRRFVKFIPSNFTKDAGQSTVPFLDGIPVESKSGPLTGIGLFHKAAKGYAGFLSLRLYSLDMARYMTVGPDFSNNLKEYYNHDDIDDSKQGDDTQ